MKRRVGIAIAAAIALLSVAPAAWADCAARVTEAPPIAAAAAQSLPDVAVMLNAARLARK